MLISKQIIEQIDEIIERSYLDFTYRVLGSEYLTPSQRTQVEALGIIIGNKTMLEIIYIIARQRSEERYLTDTTFQELLSSFVGAGSVTGLGPDFNRDGILYDPMNKYLTEAERRSITIIAASLNSKLESTKDEISRKIKNEVHVVNKEYELATKQAQVEGKDQVSTSNTSKALLIGSLLLFLPKLREGVQASFLRNFTTEMTDLVNNAVGNLVKTADQVVYKKVTGSNTCKWCMKFYVDKKGSPRYYKYSELVANGSNLGKRKEEWLPVLGATHYNCKCQLFIGRDNEVKNR